MAFLDTAVAIGIILALIYIIYTKIKGQDLKDTWIEVSELVTPKND